MKSPQKHMTAIRHPKPFPYKYVQPNKRCKLFVFLTLKTNPSTKKLSKKVAS